MILPSPPHPKSSAPLPFPQTQDSPMIYILKTVRTSFSALFFFFSTTTTIGDQCTGDPKPCVILQKKRIAVKDFLFVKNINAADEPSRDFFLPKPKQSYVYVPFFILSLSAVLDSSHSLAHLSTLHRGKEQKDKANASPVIQNNSSSQARISSRMQCNRIDYKISTSLSPRQPFPPLPHFGSSVTPLNSHYQDPRKSQGRSREIKEQAPRRDEHAVPWYEK